RGAGYLEAIHPNAAPGNTTLRIERLDVEPGAMVQFHRGGDGARIDLDDPPALDDGLVAGWARYGGDDFATYGPNGVVAYSDLHDYATNLATATSHQNVDLSHGTPMLVSDKSINALRVREGHI